MMLALFHIVGLVALHGALRDVADQVGRHGYLIIFLLIAAESFAFPLPGEVSLLVGAYEAQRGVFGLGWVIFIGALAAMSGDNLAYLFGRHAGRGLIERLLRLLHVPSTYLKRVDTYFGLHAGLTVFVARQLSPLRGLAALSAGSSHVPWRRFAGFNALGCVVWATVVSLIASVFVSRLDELADNLSLAGLIVLGAILVAVAVLAWRRLRRNVVRSEQLADVQRRDGDQKVATADRDPLAVGHNAAGPRASRHGKCVCDRPAPNCNADDKEQAS
jgi:membrane protein DedA with SNARE-associated domain